MQSLLSYCFNSDVDDGCACYCCLSRPNVSPPRNSPAKDLAKEYTQETVTVGPFVFDSSVLAWAREELGSLATADCAVVVVDEIGPLEMKRGMGLEPAFSQMISRIRLDQHVIVVVRDNLRDALSSKFDCTPTPIDLNGFEPCR